MIFEKNFGFSKNWNSLKTDKLGDPELNSRIFDTGFMLGLADYEMSYILWGVIYIDSPKFLSISTVLK